MSLVGEKGICFRVRGLTGLAQNLKLEQNSEEVGSDWVLPLLCI